MKVIIIHKVSSVHFNFKTYLVLMYYFKSTENLKNEVNQVNCDHYKTYIII